MSLHEQKCVPCKGGMPTLTDRQIADLTPDVPDWEVALVDATKVLRRTFKFRDFAQALAFIKKEERCEVRDLNPQFVHCKL